VNLNVLLLKFNLISYVEWDQQVAAFLKENYMQLSEHVLKFFATVIKAVIDQKVLTHE